MIHFFQYETRPILDSEINAGIGGAYVNCWIQADTEVEAVHQAEQIVHDNGLAITEVMAAFRVTRDFYQDNEEGLAHFEEAVREGQRVVIYTWPIGAEDDEVNYEEEEQE